MQMECSYIKCHGSGNEFVMFDAVSNDFGGVPLAELAVAACDRTTGVGADGVLLLVEQGGMYGMRMFNPDGSEAEMCGNGIRCVARAAEERLRCGEFTLFSGGRHYDICRAADIFAGLPTYGVNIGVRLTSADFGFMAAGEESFCNRVIEPLHPELRFTAINVGNPHIVARTEKIDYALLEELGRSVTRLGEVFPRGINVSLVEVRERNRIFVATYERGAGITPSCGTAMTSSATAMALIGACDYATDIWVENRGGAVVCRCSREGGLHTRLTGNATYTSHGVMRTDGGNIVFEPRGLFAEETALYERFVSQLKG